MGEVKISKKKSKLKTRLKKFFRLIRKLIILSIIAGVGYYGWTKLAPIFLGEGQAAGFLKTPEERVVYSKIVSFCEIKPRVSKEYKHDANGKLKKVNIKVGESINVGEVIAVIESTDVQKKYNEAVADMTKAKKQLVKVTEDYKNAVLLYQKELASQRQVIQAREKLNNFKGQQLKNAREGLAEAKRELEKLTLRSEFTGHVVEQDYYEGDLIMKDALICTVAKMDDLYARFYISKGYRDKIKKNMTVNFYKRLSREGDPPVGTGTITLISKFVAKKGIMIEMTFKTTKKGDEKKYVNDTLKSEIIAKKTTKKVMAIPLGALYVDKTNYYVYTLVKGITTRKDVKVGLIGYEYAEIVSGLTKKDQFISGADDFVVEGMAFKRKR